MLMGTPNYMSPEQVVGQAADQRSDVFSVGLVLYELVAYRQAFRGDSQQAVLLKVLHESPEPLRSIVPDLDPSLQAIVNRATEKAPDGALCGSRSMRSDLSRVVQRLLAAESARADPDRGTPAARGRGRARDTRRPGGRPIAPGGPPHRPGRAPATGRSTKRSRRRNGTRTRAAIWRPSDGWKPSGPDSGRRRRAGALPARPDPPGRHALARRFPAATGARRVSSAQWWSTSERR